MVDPVVLRAPGGTDRARAELSQGTSTGHGRGGAGRVSPRCSVLDVRPGGRGLDDLVAAVGDGWLLGTPIGGFSAGAHMLLELLWIAPIRAGAVVAGELLGPVVMSAHKAAIASQLSGVGSDVVVNSFSFRCVKDDWKVGSTLICPSLQFDQVVLHPLRGGPV